MKFSPISKYNILFGEGPSCFRTTSAILVDRVAVEGADSADGVDRDDGTDGTDVAEMALRLNALL